MASAHASTRRRPDGTSETPLSRRAWLKGTGVGLLSSAALAFTSCSDNPSPAATVPTLAGVAERYTRLALELAKHQPSLVDVWLGPVAWTGGPRRPVPELRTETSALRGDVQRLADAPAGVPASREHDRLTYLRGQVQALDEAAARLLGTGRPFEEEARHTFGTTTPVRDGRALDRQRQHLSELLPGRGSLAERHAEFRRSLAVPVERVESVFGQAVEWCRAAAHAVLPLPAGESLTTRAGNALGWAAFSRPTGALTSDLWVDKSGGADPAHLLQLAAHEGTPGHHAQHVLASARLVDARGWTERLLHPAFGPHKLVAEGAAEAGSDLLLPLDTRVRVCREILFPAAGQPPGRAERLVQVERLTAALDLEVGYIAADYLDTSLSAATATSRLREEALVLDPDGMLSFIEKQRSRVLAYPVGRRLVDHILTTLPDSARWARFADISTTLTLSQ